jgi:hypothetical protein
MTDPAVTTQPAAQPTLPLAASSAAPQPREGVIADNVYQRLPADRQKDFASVKRLDGDGSEWIERSRLPADPPADPRATDPTAIDPTKMAAGEKIKITGKDGTPFELDATDISRLMEQHATETLRKTQVPADPSKYDAKLPETLKLPEGVEFKIDVTDPALQDLRAWAHKRGLTQSEFSDVLGIYAAREARQHSMIQAAARAQVELMGVNGAQRIDAVSTFLRGVVGDELAGHMQRMLVSAKIVSGFEKLATRFSSQGAAPFSQAHRDHPEAPGRISEERYQAMSHAERLDYTRQWDQRAFNSQAPAPGGR